MKLLSVWLMMGLMLVAFVSSATTNTSPEQNVVCNQPYALCDTSPCIPVPGMKGKAICFCSVFNGYSFGNASCEMRKPFTDNYNRQHLTSNYSIANAKLNKVMTCKESHAWTFCLDKPCIVDPRNPNTAICTCDMRQSANFITMGGNCNTASCADTLYSAATEADIQLGNAELMKAMNLTQYPTEACPINSSN